MIITNKRTNKIKSLKFGDNEIETTNKFKLLGVLIDDKLNFNDYINKQCLSINRKMHAIKKLFYLPFEVKLQFFKTFILPYLDYCITLSIYFKQDSMKRLCKYYYLCLFKLLKFKFVNKSNSEINNELKAYGLMSFHSRLTYRLLSFATKIKLQTKPTELFEWISNLQAKNTKYNLRSNQLEIVTTNRTNSKFGDITFNSTFGKIINHFKNKIKYNIFINNFNESKKIICENIDFLTIELSIQTDWKKARFQITIRSSDLILDLIQKI